MYISKVIIYLNILVQAMFDGLIARPALPTVIIIYTNNLFVNNPMF